MTKSMVRVGTLAMACLVCACSGQSSTDDHGRVRIDDSSGISMTLYDPAPSGAASAAGGGIALRQSALLNVSATVSVFYPPPGGNQGGFCFLGVFTDSAGNVYPVNPTGVFKLLPDGTLVNGANDMNFFLLNPVDQHAALDEPAQTVYSAVGGELRSAPFVAGASFAPLMTIGSDGSHVAVGRGPLAGSLFAGGFVPPNGVILRVVVSPPSVSTFATGVTTPFAPAAIAPNGNLYVPDFNPLGAGNPPQIVRITPSGQTSIFAVGTPDMTAQSSNALAVDAAGNVYWSRFTGINVYDTAGQLRSVLPGPPDAAQFIAPTGMAFNPQGDLFLVENGGCKKMYKYDLTCGDTDPPVFTFVPPAVTSTSCSGPISIGAATAADACGPVTVTNNAPANFPLGTTVVIWTAVGSGGLTATATQLVTRALTNDPACCPAGTNIIVGTSNNNVINGTAGSDCILGLGGQDTINGLGGNDFISGGDGDDTISGGDGNDVVFGGPGRDTLNGNVGSDQLHGDDGDDQCSGGIGNDLILGGQGQDRLFGDDGADSLVGGTGDDRLEGGAGNDTLDGSGLHDICIGGPGTDVFLICETQTQ